MAEATLPSNSNREKSSSEEQSRVTKPVVTKGVKEKKPSLGSKVKESIVGDDARSVTEYLLMDVVIPATKRTISDVVSQGIDRLLFGESRPRTRANETRYTSYSARSRYASDPRSMYSEPRTLSYRARAQHDFSDLIIEDRGEAEAVIDQLGNIIDQYSVATVSDLYDLVGISSSFTDRKWGWDDIRGAEIRRTRDGYLLVLPRPIAIK